MPSGKVSRSSFFFVICVLWITCCTLVCTAWATSSAPHPNQPGPSSGNARRLVIRSDHDYPPYEFLDNGIPSGFNVDLMRALAEVTGLDIRIDLGPWNEVRAQLERGEIDALAGMFYSSERDRLVDFSKPHLQVSHSVFVRTGSAIADLGDLAEKEILVQRGDVMDDYATKAFPRAKIFRADSQVEVLRLLAGGAHDAALLGKLQNLYLLKKHGITGVRTVGQPLEQLNYCIAVREGDQALKQKIDEGLAILKASGRYDQIYDAWFGVYERDSTYSAFWRIATLVGMLVAALVAVLSATAWLLRRQVRVKTMALAQELENARLMGEALRESETRYRSIISVSNTGVWEFHREKEYLWCSPEYLTMLGRDSGDFLMDGRANLKELWLDFLHPEDRERAMCHFAEYLAKGSAGMYESHFRMLHSNGSWLWIWSRGQTMQNPDGSLADTTVGTHIDITERKLLEIRLADQLAFQEALMDTIPYAVFYKGSDTRFVGCNKAYGEMFGIRREDFIGKRVLDLEYLPDKDRLEYQAEDEAAIASVGSVRKEVAITFADGMVHQTLYAVNGFRQADGAPGGLIGVIVDISDVKRAEAAMRESEARFRAFMDNLPGYVVIKDVESRPVYFNQRFLDTFPGDRWLGKTPGEVSPASAIAQILETDDKAQPDGFVVFTEDWHDRNGEHHLLETRKFRIKQEAGQDLIGAIITDITEQRYNEEKYRVLFHASTDAIFMIKDNRIVDCNPRTLTVFDCPMERLMGHNPGEFSPPVQPDGRDSVSLALEMIERARRGDTHTFEWQHLRCDGSAFTAEVTLTVMDLFREEYVVAFLRDISERKQMQELMVQTEKMMSVGGLAAGMAHELNNPLGIILQSVQNMERRLSTSLPKNLAIARELELDLETVGEYMRARGIDEYMSGIQEAGGRAAKIIRTMLDFSRSSQSVRAACDVNEMLDTALRLAANDYDLKKKYDFLNIAIEKDYDKGVGLLECTETEIVQVLLNIIKNAAQAMAGRGDRPELSSLRLQSKLLTDVVRIEIEDNGPGMDEATRRRVFEPFFTTKPLGDGTGLGLSVGYFIITQKHKGKISVESTPGVGTMFAIELPLR